MADPHTTDGVASAHVFIRSEMAGELRGDEVGERLRRQALDLMDMADLASRASARFEVKLRTELSTSLTLSMSGSYDEACLAAAEVLTSSQPVMWRPADRSPGSGVIIPAPRSSPGRRRRTGCPYGCG